MSTTDTAPARAYFEAWNRRDADAVMATFADGARFWDVNMAAPVPAASLRDAFAGLIAAFPDLRFEVMHLVPAGEGMAVAEWRLTGTSVDGRKSVDVPGVDLFEIAGGRLAVARAYFNPGRFA